MREIIGLEPDDLRSWRPHFKPISDHLIGLTEENPQPVEGNHRVLYEAAATFRGGSFVRIVAIIFDLRHHFISEAGGKVHANRYLLGSTALTYRPTSTLV